MRATISGLARIAQCPASAVLSKVWTASSPMASRGTVIHAFLANVAQLGREEALALVPEEHREFCEVIELDRLPHCKPESYAVEVAFALNWKTGAARELGRGQLTRYDGQVDESCEIAGTSDVVGVTEDAVVVLDVKTGFADLGDALNSWQLKGYALAAARAYGKKTATVGFIRIRGDGTPWFNPAQLDEAGLDRFEIELYGLMTKAHAVEVAVRTGAPFDVREGPACAHCPAFDRCPAKVSLASAMVVGTEAAIGIPGYVLSAENALTVLERLNHVEDICERVRENLKQFASTVGPIPLPDGRVYGPVTMNVESIEAERGSQVIGAQFGTEYAYAAVKVKKTLTKSALEDALRPWVAAGPGRKITHALKGAMEALRAAGAVSISQQHRVQVHRPKTGKDKLAATNEGEKQDGVKIEKG